MAKVFFTANLRRHVDCASMEAEGTTVRDVLSQVFAAQDRLGHYVLDDQGGLRRQISLEGETASLSRSRSRMRWPSTRMVILVARGGRA